MEITAALVKQLRDKTSAGVMECKRALQDCQGDLAAAALLLNEQGLAKAARKSARLAKQGMIEPYVHAGGRIGVLIELNCETDFVARLPEFKSLAHDIAMQVAATNPQYVSTGDVPADVQEVTSAQALAELCLLSQPFIRQPDVTVHQLITQKIATIGENIRVGRFVRFELGT